MVMFSGYATSARCGIVVGHSACRFPRSSRGAGVWCRLSIRDVADGTLFLLFGHFRGWGAAEADSWLGVRINFVSEFPGLMPGR